MRIRLFALQQNLRESLWFVPGTLIFAAVAAGATLAIVDSHLQARGGATFVFGDDIAAARVVLSTIAGAMVTVTALVFSVTMLVLQLASAQFTPRVVRNFLRDRSSQVALGVFAGTFTYALVVLGLLDDPSSPGRRVTPIFSMTGAFVLVLVSIGMFVHFVNHTAQSIRVSSIIERVAAETQRIMARLFPEAAGPENEDEIPPAGAEPASTVEAPTAGVLVAVDAENLIALATEADVVIRIVPMIGDFVPLGAPLATIHGGRLDHDEEKRLLASVELGRERTMEQDPAFGIRQLVDIAIRALSPGINDPTTASQAIDQVHSLLRFLGGRRFPGQELRDAEDGRLRLVLPRPGWSHYVELAFEELRVFGAHSPQTVSRLRSTLIGLSRAVPPYRRSPLLHQLELLAEPSRARDGAFGASI